MPMSITEFDFLIVTALPEETEAVSELLEDKKTTPHDIVGKISKEDSVTSYDVGLTEIGGMGTNAAQRATREAIGRLNPKRVILTGIAAGFPETGVNRGDILIPSHIVNYEQAKIKERSKGGVKISLLGRLKALFGIGPEQERVEYEHRSLPIVVSLPLWEVATNLGRDKTGTWVNSIREVRPDGEDKRPAIHGKSTSVLGCGEKVVASQFAECRKWLLETFPNQAIGLEMESFGVLTACRSMDIPFLMIKASQDAATREKDDRWRIYATQAAASLTIELIRRFEFKDSAIIAEHMKEVIRYAQIFERDAPRPVFSYKVSMAASYALLKEGVYDLQSQDPAVLIPNDAYSGIVLHGGGGTGKTRIARSLIGSLIDEGLLPVLVDLRNYPASGRHRRNNADADTIVQEVLRCTIPRRTPGEIERMAKEGRLVVLIDGLNEVHKEARAVLIDYFRNLHRGGTCYMLVTDRFGPPETLEAFSHAAVDRLAPEIVQEIFDGEFGGGSFEPLNERLKKIYLRPFFLSLSLKTRRKFTGQSIWSGIFKEFFLTQLRMTEGQLNLVAEAILKAIDDGGSFDLSRFKSMLNGEIYQSLLGAEVLAVDESGLEHHLWCDYLASRYLAQNQNEWKDNLFDGVTTFASSLEVLSLTVEQLRDQPLKDTFLKAVFDWNYFAAADCIADFRDEDPEPRQLSLSIRSAILGAIAEKRFDAVQRTQKRAMEILQDHRYKFAAPFISAQTREILEQYVTNLHNPEDWFKQWKVLFTKGKGKGLTREEIDLISSNDSLIGWTAANLARRRELEEEEQKIIREIYEQIGNADNKKSVRWRIVHVLGAYPSLNNVDFLLKALRDDSYHWVRYGAARALIEIASRSGEDLRGRVLHGIEEFIRSYHPPHGWIRHQILQEIVETAFIRNPQLGWKDAILPILELIKTRETDQTYGKILSKRISEFQDFDEKQ